MHDLTAPLLLNGDCLQLMHQLPEHSADFVLVDLPYGITEAAWDKALPIDRVWQAINHIAKPHAIVAMFASNSFVYDVAASNRKALKYKYVWVKNIPTCFMNSKFMPLPIYEEILVFARAPIKSTWYEPQMLTGFKPYNVGPNKPETSSALWHMKTRFRHSADDKRYPRNVLFYNIVRGKKRIHPTQKPEDLLEFLVRTYCPPGGTVLDFCMGSGSTGVAAAAAGRNFIGMELDPDFFIKASCNVMLRYREAQCQQQLLQPSLTSMD